MSEIVCFTNINRGINLCNNFKVQIDLKVNFWDLISVSKIIDVKKLFKANLEGKENIISTNTNNIIEAKLETRNI